MGQIKFFRTNRWKDMKRIRMLTRLHGLRLGRNTHMNRNDDIARLEHQPKSFRGNHSHLHRLIEALQSRDTRAWDKWRKQNPTLRPDLRGLEYRVRGRRLSLGMINLKAARLSGAQLERVLAWDVRLQNADLRGAMLDQADLSYAKLQGADLEGCRLG
jgi:hypothetical protein